MAMSAILAIQPLTGIPNLSMLERCKTMAELRQIHGQMVKTGVASHSPAVGQLVAACSLSGISGSLDYAISIFCQVQETNPLAFFSMLKGFADSQYPELSFLFYAQMLLLLENLNGVEFSLPSVLKACGKISAFEEGQQLHGQVLKTHFWFDPFVSNSILRMYLELGEIGMAIQVFERIPDRDLFSWNSMITGCFKAGEVEHARSLFDEMPQRDLVSWNLMVDGYVKCRELKLAREIFYEMDHRDVVSWTTMISGYLLNSHPEEALMLFKKMLDSGIQPDVPSIVNALSAIAELGFIEEGKWVHAFVCRNNVSLCSGVLGSAFIDMYAKCGCIENAYDVFKSIMYKRSVGDWNSMISGLAIHGLCWDALAIFRAMESLGIEPDEITFLGILTACSHGGLVQEGQFFFKLMRARFGLLPRIQHYGCLIDLLSRAGQIEEAEQVIKEMPMEPDLLIWKAMLSACVKHNHVMTGERTAMHAIELAPHDSGTYILLSNIYAKDGRWGDVTRIRSMMKARGVRKVPGCSKIILHGEIHEFLVGKEIDSRYRDMVLSNLEEMVCRLKKEGYEPDLTQVLVDAKEEEKESLLSLHSEKLALSFGLINIEKERPIHIMKNLRVCCDCHLFCKVASKVYNRTIIVRDQSRFHHFRNGSCTCNEYW